MTDAFDLLRDKGEASHPTQKRPEIICNSTVQNAPVCVHKIPEEKHLKILAQWKTLFSIIKEIFTLKNLGIIFCLLLLGNLFLAVEFQLTHLPHYWNWLKRADFEFSGGGIFYVLVGLLAWIAFSYNKKNATTKLQIVLPENSDVYSQYDLGQRYNFDSTKHFNQAIYWYTKAAEQGYILAQNALGELYKTSNQNLKQAIYWYTKAAEQGDNEAQRSLGVIYNDLFDSYQNSSYLETAYMWHSVAARGDDDHWYKEMIAEEMTPEQIANAQRMAREWQAAHPVTESGK